MARDLEEFLRRAAQRRNQQQAAQAKRPEPVDQTPPFASRPAKISASGKRVSNPGPASQGERPASLPSVDLADERMSDHIHQVFDHSLGRLEEEHAPAELPVHELQVHSALSLLESLSSADEIRKAIILREVLDRPTHRW